MIFSQAQKQGIFMLIGMVLFGYAIALFFKEKPVSPPFAVSPLLLESPKMEPEKVAQSASYSFRPQQTYENQKKPYAKSKPAYKKKPRQAIPIINLNTADSAALDEIPGIGAKTANRILKYKSLVGQFVAVDQLRMIYGLSEENYVRMAPYFKIERVGELEKKDLNSEKTYKIAWIIGKEKAALITDKRKELGWFQTWAPLEEANVLTQQEIDWMKAYYKIVPSGTP
jgi:DNA uptake protein ComE-like DNA-binding protein